MIAIISFTMVFDFVHEKKFVEKGTTIFDAFVTDPNSSLQTSVKIYPYVMGLLVAISFFRNIRLFEIISNGISFVFSNIAVSKQVTDSLPVAMLRPFS